ncbi:hypothetical protein NPIL_265221, partial [Nephila pilipes]
MVLRQSFSRKNCLPSTHYLQVTLHNKPLCPNSCFSEHDCWIYSLRDRMQLHL